MTIVFHLRILLFIRSGGGLFFTGELGFSFICDGGGLFLLVEEFCFGFILDEGCFSFENDVPEAEDRSHPLLPVCSSWADSEPHPPGLSIPWPAEMENVDWGGDSLAEAGGAAEDVPVCLILGTASVTAIKKMRWKIVLFVHSGSFGA